MSHNIKASRLANKMEVSPLKQSSSKKQTNKNCFKKSNKQSGSCECNSASEMCAKPSSKKANAGTQSSRTCGGKCIKSCDHKTTIK